MTVIVGTDRANVSRDYPTNVRVPAAASGLPIDTVFLCFQIRSLDPLRFPSQVAGRLTGPWLQRVEQAARYYLGL